MGVPDPTIQLIKAFHQDMQATIQLDGKSMEPIDVDNGLRHAGVLHQPVFNNKPASKCTKPASCPSYSMELNAGHH